MFLVLVFFVCFFSLDGQSSCYNLPIKDLDEKFYSGPVILLVFENLFYIFRDSVCTKGFRLFSFKQNFR